MKKNPDINNRLFSFDELVNYNYLKLFDYSQGLKELLDELEDIKLDIEVEENTTEKEVEDLEFIKLQISYITINLKTTIEVLEYLEAKSFVFIYNSQCSLN